VPTVGRGSEPDADPQILVETTTRRVLVVERWWHLSLTAAPTASAKPKPEAGPTVYVGEPPHEQLKQLSDLGLTVAISPHAKGPPRTPPRSRLCCSSARLRLNSPG
jgi:hypothetical protein